MMSFNGRLQTTDTGKYVIPSEECIKNVNHSISGLVCNATWDTITCWPPTKAGHLATQRCPPIFGADFDKNVYKRCDLNGRWEISEFWKGFGHSDYGECIDHISAIEEVFELEETTERAGLPTIHVSSTKGIVAVTILTISLMLLLVSIISINFIIPRAVNRAAQYKISRHVFPVFMVDTLVNLLEKIFFLFEIHYGLHFKTITNTPVMCEIFITLKEYACVAAYMWLFLQCNHLRKRTKFSQHPTTSLVLYCFLGWGVPVIPTTVWAMTATLSHNVTCWTGYRYSKIIWIIDSCKIALVLGTISGLLIAIKQLLKTTGIIENMLRGNEKNCCYKRICYETVTCSLFVCYVVIVLLITMLYNHMSSPGNRSEAGDLACIIAECSKGTVLSVVFWSFNLDIRALLEVNIRRISRQELVPSSNDIEENVL